jgi:hypothetical protein
VHGGSHPPKSGVYSDVTVDDGVGRLSRRCGAATLIARGRLAWALPRWSLSLLSISRNVIPHLLFRCLCSHIPLYVFLKLFETWFHAFMSALVILRYRPGVFARLPLPERVRQYAQYTPLSTFEEQRDAGLSSSNFDLEGNIASDSRTGLDDQGTQEILLIMRRNGCTYVNHITVNRIH